jgi:3-dehydroquinate synthase
MRAATHLAHLAGVLPEDARHRILRCIDAYGPIPSLDGISALDLTARLGADKKTIHGKVHFVLPETIGKVRVITGIDPALVLEATESALTDLVAVA